METKIVLRPFERILTGFQQVDELGISIMECSYLAKRYARFGVDGYQLGSYVGTGYLQRYQECSVNRIPMLAYKQDYLIPMIFCRSENSFRLFEEPFRMDGFFVLLDWYLENNPEKLLIKQNKNYTQQRRKIIDSAYLAFRLSEILDKGAYPISHFETLDDFVEWNRIYRLIDNDNPGRHSRIFDWESPKNLSELKMILSIIRLKYPWTHLDVEEQAS